METNTRRALAIATAALLLAAPGIAYAIPPPVSDDTVASDTQQAHYGVSVTTPADDLGPIHVTITGLAAGDSARVQGAPQGWAAEDWYDVVITQDQGATGPVHTAMDAPLGWPDGVFVWRVTFPDGAVHTATFTYASTPEPTPQPTSRPTPEPTAQPTVRPSTRPTPQPTKTPTTKPERSGGLAKTGY